VKEIQLTQGYVALVDDDDFEWVSGLKWHVDLRTNKPYVAHKSPGLKKPLRLHRAVIERAGGAPIPNGMHIDHIDGNPLNNSRANLRICTPAQNGANRRTKNRNNTTGFTGIRQAPSGKWQAAVCKNNAQIYLGSFHSSAEAARAYDLGAKKHHGEFATFNFPEEQCAF
jgi:hypothetical protein